jgi:hypothetical protein
MPISLNPSAMFADAICVGNKLAAGCRNVCFGEDVSTERRSGFGRELPLGADGSALSEKFEWLTAGAGQVIEGANIHQLQSFTDLYFHHCYTTDGDVNEQPRIALHCGSCLRAPPQLTST